MAVLDLADAKAYLSITTSERDEVLTSIIAAAEAAIANKVGSLEPATRTERVGAGYSLVVPAPIVEVTSIVDADGNAVDFAADLLIDEEAGILTSSDGSAFTSRWYDVTYSQGYDPCPADLLLAVKELVRHLWGTQRGPTQRPGAAPSDAAAGTVPGAAYLLPYRVAELIAPYRILRVS